MFTTTCVISDSLTKSHIIHVCWDAQAFCFRYAILHILMHIKEMFVQPFVNDGKHKAMSPSFLCTVRSARSVKRQDEDQLSEARVLSRKLPP